MIDCTVFEFACPPHVLGASWMLLQCVELDLCKSFPTDLRMSTRFPLAPGNLLRVSMVCHPLEWLKAAFVQGRQVGEGPDLDGLYRAGSFEAYIESYLSRCPGAVGALFSQYQADTVIRGEDLPAAFVDLIDPLHELPRGFIDFCRGHRPIIGMNHSLHLPDQLRLQVFDAEKELVQTYDYW